MAEDTVDGTAVPANDVGPAAPPSVVDEVANALSGGIAQYDSTGGEAMIVVAFGPAMRQHIAKAAVRATIQALLRLAADNPSVGTEQFLTDVLATSPEPRVLAPEAPPEETPPPPPPAAKKKGRPRLASSPARKPGRPAKAPPKAAQKGKANGKGNRKPPAQRRKR